ncbi:MAG: hypothetical protein ACPG4T_12325 [Nannocystaceae bacterium]
MKKPVSCTWAAFAMVLLTGCGDDSNSSTDDGSESGSETVDPTAGGADANPRSGLWSYEDQGIEENSCGMDLYRDPDTTFGLTNHNDNTFTVDQGSSAEDFDCTITGSSFNCPLRLYGEYPIDGVDAKLKYTVSIDGTFASDTAMTGTQMAVVSCEGEACQLAPQVLGVDFPCNYTVAFGAMAN